MEASRTDLCSHHNPHTDDMRPRRGWANNPKTWHRRPIVRSPPLPAHPYQVRDRRRREPRHACTLLYGKRRQKRVLFLRLIAYVSLRERPETGRGGLAVPVTPLPQTGYMLLMLPSAKRGLLIRAFMFPTP